MKVWVNSMKEVLRTVAPIVTLVLFLHFTFVPLETDLLIRFLLGTVLIIFGLSFFLLGVEKGVTPFGVLIGEKTSSSNRISMVVCVGMVLGLMITIAEPDLHILADQVSAVTGGAIGKWLLVILVSLGISILLTVGLLRIVYSFPLYLLLTGLYGVILILSFFVSPEFLAIAFDSSGATTGAMTVPFILSLSFGISALKKNGKASEKDSFGLVGTASTGAILAVLLLNIVRRTALSTTIIEQNGAIGQTVGDIFGDQLSHLWQETAIALLPLVALFIIGQLGPLRVKKRAFIRILVGFLYTFIGLVLFLVGVNAGFMDVGRQIGSVLAGRDSPSLLLVFGFALGFVTILAEPAVHVLTERITEVTSGSVPRRAVLAALSIGVGLSVALSVMRILIPGLQLWHILLPGYLLAIVLSFLGPKLFVGMAFDAGGVASGPMTATFILAFAQGAAERIATADVLVDGFGVIALVAMTPVVTLQILGFIYRSKTKKGGVAAHGRRE